MSEPRWMNSQLLLSAQPWISEADLEYSLNPVQPHPLTEYTAFALAEGIKV